MAKIADFGEQPKFASDDPGSPPTNAKDLTVEDALYAAPEASARGARNLLLTPFVACVALTRVAGALYSLRAQATLGHWYNESVDVYSLSLTIFELLVGDAHYIANVRKKQHLPRNAHCSPLYHGGDWRPSFSPFLLKTQRKLVDLLQEGWSARREQAPRASLLCSLAPPRSPLIVLSVLILSAVPLMCSSVSVSVIRVILAVGRAFLSAYSPALLRLVRFFSASGTGQRWESSAHGSNTVGLVERGEAPA